MAALTLLVVLLVLALVGGPVLAIVAFARVRRLEQKSHASSLGFDSNATSSQLRALEQRVSGIEKALGLLIARVDVFSQSPAANRAAIPPPIPAAPLVSRPEPPQVSPPAQPPPRAPQPAAQPAPLAAPISQPAAQTRPLRETLPPDFENVVAGKWLNYVGILAILFAATFFLKYAFDNNWVGPAARVGIGLASGALLILWSEWLLRRGYRYFSEGIVALGGAVLYLSLWAASHYYDLFSPGGSFVGMVAVTAALVAISLRRDSQRLALLALIGGFLTPALLSTGGNHEIVLFSYIALLSAAMLVLERVRSWSWLPPLAFFATQLYFWGWYSSFFVSGVLYLTLAFALLFFLIFSALPLLSAHREGRITAPECFIAVANTAYFLVALEQMLWPESRWALTLWLLVLAAAHLLAAHIPTPEQRVRTPLASLSWLYTGLSLLCLSLAIPARLENQWLTITWAVEGVVLVWLGVRFASVWLRAAGLAFLAITALRLIIFRLPGGAFLWNQRFLTFAAGVASFALACFFVRKIADSMAVEERAAFAFAAVAINVYALIALSMELWDFLGNLHSYTNQGWSAQELGLSILWTIYATGLILFGMMRRSPLLRWQALALFAIVVVRVFFFDLASLSRFYRIISFFVLGILLLAVSFLYQRRAQRNKSS
ncbi:MAG TPA: DUF2339 domain-containing protein [Candidatus Acidoferrales bacterium]|nr:DUF2339 domain-containing protein [Candidatus Acidoferrales bacterium]